MQKVIVNIGGMACSMCEAHINDVIRKLYPNAKSVRSSHKKNMTEFVIEGGVDADEIRRAVEGEGYLFEGISARPYEKRGLFGLGASK